MLGNREDVLVAPQRGDAVVPDGDKLDGLHLVAKHGSTLEVEPLGSLLHLLGERIQHLSPLALQEEKRAVHRPPILLAADGTDARSRTQSNVHIKARPRPVDREGAGADAQAEHLPYQVKRLMNGPGARKRPEVHRVALCSFAGDGHTRPFASNVHLDEWKALVIFQSRVVLGRKRLMRSASSTSASCSFPARMYSMSDTTATRRSTFALRPVFEPK